jgi:hypothetical protein
MNKVKKPVKLIRHLRRNDFFHLVLEKHGVSNSGELITEYRLFKNSDLANYSGKLMPELISIYSIEGWAILSEYMVNPNITICPDPFLITPDYHE